MHGIRYTCISVWYNQVSLHSHIRWWWHAGNLSAWSYEMVSFRRLAKKYSWSKPSSKLIWKGEDGCKIWTKSTDGSFVGVRYIEYNWVTLLWGRGGPVVLTPKAQDGHHQINHKDTDLITDMQKSANQIIWTFEKKENYISDNRRTCIQIPNLHSCWFCTVCNRSKVVLGMKTLQVLLPTLSITVNTEDEEQLVENLNKKNSNSTSRDLGALRYMCYLSLFNRCATHCAIQFLQCNCCSKSCSAIAAVKLL